jgi:hypothetical protein
VEIFHEALRAGRYTSFLGQDTALPMMYMDDAIRATLELMETPLARLPQYKAYNLAGISFTPAQIAQAIRAELPDFTIDYAPDFRQAIADSWPRSLDDREAQADWGWTPRFGLQEMVREMLAALPPAARPERRRAAQASASSTARATASGCSCSMACPPGTIRTSAFRASTRATVALAGVMRSASAWISVTGQRTRAAAARPSA